MITFSDLLIFFAGLIGGVMNSLAGGGSVVTIAALSSLGIPPLIANSTNTVATLIGYLSGAYRLRDQIDWNWAKRLMPYALFGGAAGAMILRATPAPVFADIVPYLLLGATLLFAFGGRRSGLARSLRHLAIPIFMIVTLYGGYFQAGLGILLLAVLSPLIPKRDLPRLSALKLVISAANAMAASLVLVQADMINWRVGGILMLGLAMGGYLGGRWTTTIPLPVLRGLILAICLAVTIPLFF